MMRLGSLLIISLTLTAQAALGQEVVGQANANEGTKTSYYINNDYTTVTTVAAGVGNKFDSQMDTYLFPSLKRSLEGMAFVTSLIQTKGQESIEVHGYSDYDTKKRKSHAFLKIAAQSPVTLLFEIDETYRKCKPAKGTTGGYAFDELGASNTGDCSKQSTITVRGPVAVYGNYASSVNVDSLLRNKQELSLTLEKDYSKVDTSLTTRFSIKSVSFDESLARFFRVLNIPIFNSRSDTGIVGSSFIDKMTPLTSRQRLMLSISRVARSANERILNQ